MQENQASRMFLIAAAVLGVLATVIAFTWLESQSGQDRDAPIKIVVAKRDLRPDQMIDPVKDLEVTEIPGKYTKTSSLVLRPDAMAACKGQRINRYVAAGEPIFLAYIAMPMADIDTPSGNQNAITIQARRERGLGGNLVPGDWVKMFVTMPVLRAAPAAAPAVDPTDPTARLVGGTGGLGAQSETELVLSEPVKVLMVGRRAWKTRQAVTAAEQYTESAAGESEEDAMVMVQVTQAEAQTYLQKTDGGQLPVYMMLCPPPPGAAAATAAAPGN